jgi:hypothetical protein
MWAFGGLGSLFAFILLLVVSIKTKTQLGFMPYILLPIGTAFLYMAWRKYQSPKPINNKQVKEENRTLIYILAVALITLIVKKYLRLEDIF